MTIAILLLSGGLDSTTGLWWAKEKYDQVHCITFSYGSSEEKSSLEVTKNLANLAKSKVHKIIKLDWLNEFSKLRDSKLVDGTPPNIDNLDDLEEATKTAEQVWIPARNLCFLSIAASYADAIKQDCDIIYCANLEEGATFPDNTKEFIDKFNEILKYGVFNLEVKIIAPLFDKTKKEIVKFGKKLDVPFEYSCSCYSPQGLKDKKPIHCGVCESDKRRIRAFKEAKVEDRTEYI